MSEVSSESAAGRVLTIERAEQLRALGHPLRLRVLEELGHGGHLTNRELGAKLGVDPGHLDFQVRLLHRAGLIERVGSGGGREKPYRAVASTVRVAPELMSTGFARRTLRRRCSTRFGAAGRPSDRRATSAARSSPSGSTPTKRESSSGS